MRPTEGRSTRCSATSRSTRTSFIPIPTRALRSLPMRPSWLRPRSTWPRQTRPRSCRTCSAARKSGSLRTGSFPPSATSGPAGIRSSLSACPDPAARSVLAFLLRAGATVENVPELQEVLGAGEPGAWSSAVVACERLDQPGCWAALDASLDGHDALDQLTARMAEWRKQRVSAEDLFAAAQSLVTLALNVPPGPDRARMWNKLDEFVRLALAGGLAIPRSLVTSLRALGSPVIEKDLTGALVK